MLRRTLICLIFAVVCSLAESGLYKRSACIQAKFCLKPRLDFRIKRKRLNDFDLTDKSTLTQFCNMVAAQTQCLDKRKSDCDYGESIEKETAVDKYICSNNGQKQIGKMKKSQCVRQNNLVQEALKSLQVCHLAFEKKYTELLSYKLQKDTKTKDFNSRMKSALNEWRTCCKDEATKWCGAEYGQFIKSLMTNDKLSI